MVRWVRVRVRVWVRVRVRVSYPTPLPCWRLATREALSKSGTDTARGRGVESHNTTHNTRARLELQALLLSS